MYYRFLSVNFDDFYINRKLSVRGIQLCEPFPKMKLKIPGTSIVFCVQSLCGLKFELRVRSKAIFVKTRLNYVTNRQLNAFENQMPEISAIYSRK